MLYGITVLTVAEKWRVRAVVLKFSWNPDHLVHGFSLANSLKIKQNILRDLSRIMMKFTPQLHPQDS
jgi:hypothetical protein